MQKKPAPASPQVKPSPKRDVMKFKGNWRFARQEKEGGDV